jgi:hypothetical protein
MFSLLSLGSILNMEATSFSVALLLTLHTIWNHVTEEDGFNATQSFQKLTSCVLIT